MARARERTAFDESFPSEWELRERFVLGQCLYCTEELDEGDLKHGAVFCSACHPSQESERP